MLVLNGILELQKRLKMAKKNGQRVGFVPTMGALHKGHLALIAGSKKGCDLTICSIFVNPTQFNDKHDFEKYPSTLDKDIEILKKSGCDILFAPNVREMYPDGFKNDTKINFGYLATTLEGEHRPGHFDGMAQIVEKLLRIVKPSMLFMGQKDYQQQIIVNQLIKKRDFKTKLVVCPTVREKDGLAMSSRNVRLDPEARKLAVEISKTLKAVKSKLAKSDGSIKNIERWGVERLSGFKAFEVEYLSIRNANSLKPPKRRSEKLVVLTAAKIGGVRLIDNMLLN